MKALVDVGMIVAWRYLPYKRTLYGSGGRRCKLDTLHISRSEVFFRFIDVAGSSMVVDLSANGHQLSRPDVTEEQLVTGATQQQLTSLELCLRNIVLKQT